MYSNGIPSLETTRAAVHFHRHVPNTGQFMDNLNAHQPDSRRLTTSISFSEIFVLTSHQVIYRYWCLIHKVRQNLLRSYSLILPHHEKLAHHSSSAS